MISSTIITKRSSLLTISSAKHLDNDQETIVKESASKFHEHRPTYYRSNSVTIGLLHRSTHREDDDDVLQTGNDLEQLITKEKQG